MTVKKRVIAYFDGSNFYHHMKSNYGITNVNFKDIVDNLLELSKEEIVKIRYFNCPLNQQENPMAAAGQLRFFEKLRKTPFVDISLGKLVKRTLTNIHISCRKCGHQEAEQIKCPKCKTDIELNRCFKTMEKGVDVKLAITMLLDALQGKYDIALLFSGDADFSPAIKHIINHCNKQVVYCHFPTFKTNELLQICSGARLITKEIAEKSSNH